MSICAKYIRIQFNMLFYRTLKSSNTDLIIDEDHIPRGQGGSVRLKQLMLTEPSHPISNTFVSGVAQTYGMLERCKVAEGGKMLE